MTIINLFTSTDTDMYVTWKKGSGIVELLIPGTQSVKMTAAKAEDIAEQLKQSAKNVRSGIED